MNCLGNEVESGCVSTLSIQKDLTGRKFGAWTVLYQTGCDKWRALKWMCQCDCGVQREITGKSLRSGRSLSCGCLQVEKFLKERSITIEESLFRDRLRGYKHAAIERHLDWQLSDSEAKYLMKGCCQYCGVPPSNKANTRKRLKKEVAFVYNGIDRIDNTKGYTLSNCVSCCYICNRAKSNLTHEEFISWVKSVYEHNFKMRKDD